MVPISYWIVPTSHIMILISHLMVPIEWVPYPQKECGYCKMTLDFISNKFCSIHTSFFFLLKKSGYHTHKKLCLI